MAATYYISPTGSDSTGDGSSGSPWLTISKAHTGASSGDTIIATSGTHNWLQQNFTKSLTIQGETGVASDVIFDGGNLNPPGNVAWWGMGADNVVLTMKYIRFTNVNNNTATTNNGPTFCIGGYASAADRYKNSLNMDRCIVDDVGITGFYELGGLFATTNQSVDFTGYTSSIKNSLFYDIRSNGTGNRLGIFQNRSHTTFGFEFTNNTVYLKTGNALDQIFSGRFGSANVKNNIFQDADGLVYTHGNNGAGFGGNSPVYSYSCAHDVQVDSDFTDGTGNITSDPLFVDPDNNNFNLQPASPCGWGIGTLT